VRRRGARGRHSATQERITMKLSALYLGDNLRFGIQY
jgi:hypothetical protein